MTIKEAMHIYFDKLNKLYKNKYNTLPTVSYVQKDESKMFIGEPDDDGEIQWQPVSAKRVEIPGLCFELNEFFSSYYYWQLDGTLNEISYYFPHVTNMDEAIKVAKNALNKGKKLFPNSNNVIIATCTINGADDILLVYNQDNKTIFYYDLEFEKVISCDLTLIDLLIQMNPVL